MMEWMLSSSVLILVLMGARGFLRRKISARLQYALWAVVLLRLLTPWNPVESAISVLNVTRQPELQAVVKSAREPIRFESQALILDEESGESSLVHKTSFVADGEDLNRLYSPADIAFEIWKWGCILLSCFMSTSNLIFLRKLKKNRRKMEIQGINIPVYISPMAQTPCLAGLVFPAVYLPDQTMEPGQLRHVLAHERTHYRHADHIFSVLRCVVLALHWYNPLVWWAAKASKQDGELACDEGTISWLGEHERIAYGKTLLEMTCEAKHEKVMLTTTAMYAGKNILHRRMQRIARRTKTRTAAVCVLFLVMIVAVGCTFTGAVDGVPRTDAELVEFLKQGESSEEIAQSLELLVRKSMDEDGGVMLIAADDGLGYGYGLSQERSEAVARMFARYEWKETVSPPDSEESGQEHLAIELNTQYAIYSLTVDPGDEGCLLVEAWIFDEGVGGSTRDYARMFRAEPKEGEPALHAALMDLYSRQKEDSEQQITETRVDETVEEWTEPAAFMSGEEMIRKLEQSGEMEETLVWLSQESLRDGVGIYEKTNYGRRGKGHGLSGDQIESLEDIFSQYQWSRETEIAAITESDRWMELVFGVSQDTGWRVRLQCGALDQELVFLHIYDLEDGKITGARENLIFRAVPRNDHTASLYEEMGTLFGGQVEEWDRAFEETVVSGNVE